MSDTGIILVTAATGNNGSAVIQNLVATKANIRALVHHESKAQGLREVGVEVVFAAFSLIVNPVIGVKSAPISLKMASFRLPTGPR